MKSVSGAKGYVITRVRQVSVISRMRHPWNRMPVLNLPTKACPPPGITRPAKNTEIGFIILYRY